MLCRLAAVLLLAGCYSPRLESPGYYCHAGDNPACPEGQACLDSRCVSLQVGDDLATASDGGDAAASAMPDFATPSCLPTGGGCPGHDDAICCSHYCVYKTNKCK